MSAPSVAGVRRGKMMLLLGRLPSKILDLTSASDALGPSSWVRSHQRSAPHIHALWETDLPNLLLGLTEGQGFRLGKEVGEEDAMMLRARDGVVGGGGCEEVGRNELRALMHELVERVLTVRASSTPDDWLAKFAQRGYTRKQEQTYASLVGDALATFGD